MTEASDRTIKAMRYVIAAGARVCSWYLRGPSEIGSDYRSELRKGTKPNLIKPRWTSTMSSMSFRPIEEKTSQRTVAQCMLRTEIRDRNALLDLLLPSECEQSESKTPISSWSVNMFLASGV